MGIFGAYLEQREYQLYKVATAKRVTVLKGLGQVGYQPKKGS